MLHVLIRTVAGLACIAPTCGVWAQESPQVTEQKPIEGDDKGGYWLMKKTPSKLMRDMSTDRPDTTESAYTVDAGHFQLEMSLVDYTFDRRNEEKATRRSVSVAPFLIKAGILNDFDLQLGVDPYTRERQTNRATGERTTISGFGDITVLAKFNIWGNDGGETAFALMPFIKIPTAKDELGNGKVEGGLIVPLAIDLGNDVGMGLMTEFDIVRDGGNERYTLDWVHTATIGFPLIEEMGGYIEYAGFMNLNHAERYRGYFDGGLTYAINANVVLDAGVRIGLTRAADDLGFFAGISWRY